MSWVKEFLGFGRNVNKRSLDTDNQDRETPAKKRKLKRSPSQCEESPATQFIRSIGSRMASWISPKTREPKKEFADAEVDSLEDNSDSDEEEAGCQALEDIFLDAENTNVVDLTNEPKKKEKADIELLKDDNDSVDEEEEVVLIKVVKNNATNSVQEEQTIKYDSPIKTFTGPSGTFTEETTVTVTKTKKLTLVKTPNKEKKIKAKSNNYNSSKNKNGHSRLDVLRMRNSLKQVIKLDERDKYFDILTNYSGSYSPHITYQSSIQHQRHGMTHRKNKVTATQNPNVPIINLDPEVVTIDTPVTTIEGATSARRVSAGNNVFRKNTRRMKSVPSPVKRNIGHSPDFLSELRKKYDSPRNGNILGGSLNSKFKEVLNSSHTNKNMKDKNLKQLQGTQIDLAHSDDEEVVDLDFEDDKEVIDLDSSDETEVVGVDESDTEVEIIHLESLDLESEIEEIEHLAEITEEMTESIESYCNAGDELLIDRYEIQIFRKDIDTLEGLNWLNDSIINFYMQMIMKRSQNPGYPKVYASNTFFYPKLMASGQSGLRRWTRNIDIFSCDLMMIPVHLGMHWCLAVVDFRKSGVFYYDSMGGNNRSCLVALLQYIEDEHEEKKGSVLDMSRYSAEIVKNMPQQLNGSDCGVFACKFAEYLSRDASISFSQKDMPHFRRRMIWEIAEDTLLHP